MRGVYSARIVHTALAAAKDLLILTAPANRVIEILSAHISNRTQETNEQLEAGLFRATAAGVGAATAITKKPHEPNDAASGATLEHTYATTQNVLDADPVGTTEPGFASLSGWHHTPIPEERIYVTGTAAEPDTNIIALRLITATFTAFDCVASITWREIG